MASSSHTETHLGSKRLHFAVGFKSPGPQPPGPVPLPHACEALAALAPAWPSALRAMCAVHPEPLPSALWTSFLILSSMGSGLAV